MFKFLLTLPLSLRENIYPFITPDSPTLPCAQRLLEGNLGQSLSSAFVRKSRLDTIIFIFWLYFSRETSKYHAKEWISIITSNVLAKETGKHLFLVILEIALYKSATEAILE